VLKYLGARSAKDGPTPGLPSCTLSRAVAQSFLREALTTKQLRIEIYSNGNKKGTPWKVVKTASPGNLQDVEDLLFANSDIMEAPVLMSIKLTVKDAIKTCGIAFVDTSIRSLGVTEFVDNELFSNTEVPPVLYKGASGLNKGPGAAHPARCQRSHPADRGEEHRV
jgi:DNA mismatch repair protein MSH2